MPVSNPSVTYNLLPAETIAMIQPQRVLLIGQKTSAGNATSGALVQDIPNDGSEDILFGANSMMAEMVRAFKRINTFSRLDAISLADNGSGVAATGTITFVATPTAVGTLTFYIGSSVNHSYAVPITTSSTATTIAAALVALVTADLEAPVTAANTAGVVTLTAVNKGTVGNGIGIQFIGAVAGVTVTVVAMASGATDPSLTGLFSPVANTRYQTIAYPSEYTISTLTTNFLDTRFNVNNSLLDGVGIITKADTLSNLITLGNANNSQSLVIIGNKLIARNTFNGGAIFELSYVISSYFAAVRSLRFTQDANLSRYVVGSQSRDQFGSAALASLPYFNTPFYNLPLVIEGDEFSQTEQAQLGAAGVSVLGNNIAMTQVIAGAIYTTYKTNAAGDSDPTYQFLNYVDTLVNSREYMFNNAKSDFGNSRLTSGNLLPNRKMQNEGSIAAAHVGYYQILSGQDYVLVPAGEDALQFFKQNLNVTLDLSTGNVNIAMKLPIVTQLRVIIATVQMTFNINN